MFITVEGRHSSGKTYITDKIYQRLRGEGYSVVKTREPTETRIGQFARASENMYFSKTLTCLYAADRIEHCNEIRHWLNKGEIVICDRYIVSAMVLQNMDGVDFSYINAVNSGILEPDLTIVLHADELILKGRLKRRKLSRLAEQERREKKDRFLQYEDDIKKMAGKTIYFENNTEQDAEDIVKFVVGEVECNCRSKIIHEMGRDFRKQSKDPMKW